MKKVNITFLFKLRHFNYVKRRFLNISGAQCICRGLAGQEHRFTLCKAFFGLALLLNQLSRRNGTKNRLGDFTHFLVLAI